MKEKRPKKRRLLIIIGIILVVAVVAIFLEPPENGNGSYQSNNHEEISQGYNDNAANEETLEQSQNETAYEPIYYNIDQFVGFHQFTPIPLGIHESEAIIALGNPTSTMTMDIMGTETTTVTWFTLNFFGLSTSDTVTFTNGYATSIMSTADTSSNITAQEFGQITNGMNEIEVFEILGMPYSVTIVEILGTTSITVMWINQDFTSGTITFTNGTVSSTLTMGLS
ncbi:MAG: hypothetical protein FWG63_02500 [Defluviitaleaceae bacterium]|nr:hypothetical protein [Defluviitaleaceae bacterium]